MLDGSSEDPKIEFWTFMSYFGRMAAHVEPPDWRHFMGRSLLLSMASLVAIGTLRADELDREPIRYGTAPAVNAVSRLEAKIAADPKLLRHADEKDFLRGLLAAFEIPVSSQT